MIDSYFLNVLPKSPREIGEISQSIAADLAKDEKDIQNIEVFNTYRSKGHVHQWMSFIVRITHSDNSFDEHIYKIKGYTATLQQKK